LALNLLDFLKKTLDNLNKDYLKDNKSENNIFIIMANMLIIINILKGWKKKKKEVKNQVATMSF